MRRNRSNSNAQNEELNNYQETLRAIKKDIRKIHRTASNDDMNPSVEVLATLADVPVDLEALREEELNDQAILEAHKQAQEEAQCAGESFVVYIHVHVYVCKIGLIPSNYVKQLFYRIEWYTRYMKMLHYNIIIAVWLFPLQCMWSHTYRLLTCN